MPPYDNLLTDEEQQLDYSSFPSVLPPEGRFQLPSYPAPLPSSEPGPPVAPLDQAAQDREGRAAQVRDYRRREGGYFSTDSRIGRGLSRGTAQLIQSGGDFMDLLGKIAGPEFSWLKVGRKIGDYGSEIASNIPSEAPPLRDIVGEIGSGKIGQGLSDLGVKTVEAISEQIPQLIPSLISAGMFRSMTAGAQLSKQGLKWGTHLAAAVPAGIQEAGGNYRGIREETAGGGDSPWAPWIALGSGIASGFLEAVTPARLVSKFFDEAAEPAKKLLWRNLIRETLKEVPKIAGQEFATEAAQEIVSVTANKLADNTYDLVTPGNIWRVLDAGVSGMLAGAGIGSVNPAMNTAYNKYARANELVKLTNQRDRNQAIKVISQIVSDATDQAKLAAKEGEPSATQTGKIQEGSVGEHGGNDPLLQEQGANRNVPPQIVTQSDSASGGNRLFEGGPVQEKSAGVVSPDNPVFLGPEDFVYEGWQTGYGSQPGYQSVRLLRDVGQFPARGSLNRQTLADAGYVIPEKVFKLSAQGKATKEAVVPQGQSAGNQNVEATGIEEIRNLLASPGVKLPAETVKLFDAILQQPVMRKLDWSKMKVAIQDGIQGGWQGSATVARNLIEISRSANREVPAHEIFHFLHELLPDQDLRQLDLLRRAEVQKALAKAEADGNPIARKYLSELLTKQHTVDDFVARAGVDPASRQYASLRPYAHLMNTSEFLATLGAEKFSRQIDRAHHPIIAKIKEYALGFLDALRRTFHANPSFDQLYRELLAGKHQVQNRALPSTQPFAVPDLPHATPTAVQPALATIAVGVAPYRNKEIATVQSLDVVSKSDPVYREFARFLSHVTDLVGLTGVKNIDTTGGWYNPEVVRNLLEASRRVTGNTPDSLPVRLFSALAGALAPDVQQSVYILNHDPNGPDTEHKFTFDTIRNLENVVRTLNGYNLGDGFSVDNKGVALYIGDLGNAKEQSGDLGRFVEFASKVGLREATATIGKIDFPSERTYRATLQEARRTGYLQRHPGFLNDLVAQAETRLNERGRKILTGRRPGEGAGSVGRTSPTAVPLAATAARSYFDANRDRLGLERWTIPGPGVVDADAGAEIGQAYQDLPVDDSSNPEVVRAYAAMVAETDAQYRHMLETGLKVDFTPNDPYPGGPADMVRDVKENGHLGVFTGGEDHPLLGSSTKDAQGLTANDKFRAIHDFYGHASEGNTFGEVGEERAWLAHAQMFSPLARQAMTTETRGQNSWVNFGPSMWNGDGWRGLESNPKFVPRPERPFATQKAALLPPQYSEINSARVSSPEGIVMADGRQPHLPRATPPVKEPKGWKEISSFFTPQELAGKRADFMRQAVKIFKRVNVNELVAAGLAGKEKLNWYADTVRVLNEMFGADAPMFVGILAATSPQHPVRENFTVALRFWNNYLEAGRPTNLNVLEQVFAKTDSRLTKDSGFKAWRNNVLRVLNGEEIGPGSEKVYRFWMNLMGDTDAVTLDVWMARLLMVDQVDFADADLYQIYSAKVREAANKLGWKPVEVQETTWAFLKTLWEKAEKLGGRLSDIVVNLSDEEVRRTPDFFNLVIDPKIRPLIERLGIKIENYVKPRSGTRTGGGANTENLREGSFFPPPLNERLGPRVSGDLRNLVRSIDKTRPVAKPQQFELGQNTRQPALAETPARAKALIEESGTRGPVAQVLAARMIMGQVGFLERKLQEHLPAATAGLSARQAESVMNMIGYLDILHTQVMAGAIVPNEEYVTAMNSIPIVLRQTYSKEVGFRFKLAEKKLNDVLTEYGKLDEKLKGKSFQNLVARANAKSAHAHLLEQIQKFFEADTAQGIADAKKLLAETDQNKGGADMLLKVLKTMEDKAAHTEAVKAAVSDIINTMASKEQGIELLMNAVPGATNPLIEMYMADRQYGRPEDIIVGWAAELIAKAKPVTEGLVAIATMNKDKEIRDQYDHLSNTIAQAFEKNPKSTAKAILSEGRKFATKAERAMAAFRAIQSEVMDTMNDWVIAKSAAEAANDALTDPETQAYKSQVYKDAGIQERPGDADEYDSPDLTRGITLPDGTTTGKIEMFGDATDFTKTYQTLNDAIDKIGDWLVKNPDDVARDYWQRKMEYLLNVLATSRTLAPSKFTKLFNWERFPFSPLGMTKHFVDALGTRMAGLLKVSLSNHSRSVELAYNLLSKSIGKFTNLSRAAVRSHGFTGGLNRSVSRWFEEIGNPLYSSWQNPEGGLTIGDKVNGYAITKQDFQLMQFVSSVSAEGFGIVQRDISKGREGLAQTVVFKTNIGTTGVPVYVTSSKITEHTMPRTFRRKALAWIKGYPEAVDKEKFLNANFMNIVARHLADRANTIHDGPSLFEGAYAHIASQIADAGLLLANRNMDWLSDQVAGFTGKMPADIKPAIMSEFQKMFERLGRETPAIDEARDVEVHTIHPEGPFTKSRKDKLAGDWLYTHGFANTPDLIQFVLGVQGYYYERAIKDFENVRLDLERQSREMAAKIQALVNQGKDQGEAIKAVVKAQTRNVQLGKTFDDYRNLAVQISHTEKIIKLFKDVFGARGGDSDFDLGALKRVLGLTTQGTLFSDMVQFRNIWSGWLYIGQSMSRYQGTLLPSMYAKAAWETAVSGAKFLLSGATGLVRGVARLPEGVALAKISVKDEGYLQALARFFQPMAEELTHHLYARIDLQREMMARGYQTTPLVVEDYLSRLAAPSKGGVVVDGEDYTDTLTRLGNGGMAALAFMFEAPIPIMTFGREFGRISEAILNQAAMKTGFDMVGNLEKQLRSTFETWNKTGANRFDFAQLNSPLNLLTPEEIFGALKVGTRTTIDLSHLKTLFEYSGIGLQEAAIRFLASLDAGNYNARFLTDDQSFSVAAQLMQEVNRASVMNRPLMLRKRSFLWQIVAPLLGWNANRLAVDIRQAALPQGQGQAQAQALMAIWIGFVLPALAAGAAGDVTGELLMRLIASKLRGEIRPTRLPWEREGTKSKAIGWLIAAANPIPFVQTVVNLALNDLPQKASASPTIFAQSKILDLIDYVGGVVNTGNPLYGLPRLVKSFIPLSGAVINRLPGVEGSVESMNVRRLLTRYGPQDLLKPAQLGHGSASATPLSPIMDRAVNALMRSDEHGFAQAQADYIAKATEMGKDKPERDFAQSLKARNPYNRAFKTKLDPDQREAMLAKMSDGERAMVLRGEAKFQAGLDMVGGKDTEAMAEGIRVPRGTSGGTVGGGGEGGGGGGGASARPKAGRFRSLGRRPRISSVGRARSMVRGYRLPSFRKSRRFSVRTPRLRTIKRSRLRLV